MRFRRSRITEPPPGSISISILDSVNENEEVDSINSPELEEQHAVEKPLLDDSTNLETEEERETVAASLENDNVNTSSSELESEEPNENHSSESVEQPSTVPAIEEDFAQVEREKLLLNGKDPVSEIFRLFFAELSKEKEDPNLETLEYIEDKYILFPSVADFHRNEVRPLENEQTVKAGFILDKHTSMTVQERYRIMYVYTNYSFIRNQLTTLITRHEGSACSSDKMRMLLKYYISQEIFHRKGSDELMSPPGWTERDKWRVTRHVSKWVKLLDSLPSLAIGNPDLYLEAITELDAAYSESKYSVVSKPTESTE